MWEFALTLGSSWNFLKNLSKINYLCDIHPYTHGSWFVIINRLGFYPYTFSSWLDIINKLRFFIQKLRLFSSGYH
jgi:hypothetical protein